VKPDRRQIPAEYGVAAGATSRDYVAGKSLQTVSRLSVVAIR